METFSLHCLITVLALLGCVFPSAHLAAATITAALIPWKQQIPVGGQIGLNCTLSETPNCGYKSFLYRVKNDSSEEGDVRPMQDIIVTSCRTCSCDTSNSLCYSSTYFLMTGTIEASGKYGCKGILEDEPQPTALVERTGSNGSRPHEATVFVCKEPEIILKSHNLNNYTNVDAIDNCNFASELSWRINGRLIPRESASPAPPADFPPPAAVYRDTGRLEIRTSCDRFASRTTCNITAEFSYISASRLKVANMTTVIDCCGFFPSTEVPNKPFQTQQPKGLETKSPEHRADLTEHSSSPGKVRPNHGPDPPQFVAEISAVVLGAATIALGAVACYYRGRWKRLKRCTPAATVPGSVDEV